MDSRPRFINFSFFFMFEDGIIVVVVVVVVVDCAGIGFIIIATDVVLFKLLLLSVLNTLVFSI